MKGDFSRETFDRTAHFRRVLQQQGRVQLDADWNEQMAILLHYLETSAADLIGPHAGPAADCGFRIGPALLDKEGMDWEIGPGRYYVDGILVEHEPAANGLPTTYRRQPSLPTPQAITQPGHYLIYLDVWERHVTAAEAPAIREEALGGPDTTTRTQTVWQVHALSLPMDAPGLPPEEIGARLEEATDKLHEERKALTEKRAALIEEETEPPLEKVGEEVNEVLEDMGEAIATGIRAIEDVGRDLLAALGLRRAHHRARAGANGGLEAATQRPKRREEEEAPEIKEDIKGIQTGINREQVAILRAEEQLHALRDIHLDCRVEARDPSANGLAGRQNRLYRVEIHDTNFGGTATFKWSADNGSIIYPIVQQGNAWLVERLNYNLPSAETWLERIDDNCALSNVPGEMKQARDVVTEDGYIIDGTPVPDAKNGDRDLHPLLRCWDQNAKANPGMRNGVIPIASAIQEQFYELEEGVQIRFRGDGLYTTGDYWLIPVRGDGAVPEHEVPRREIVHHYAPLAYLHLKAPKTKDDERALLTPHLEDLRQEFAPLAHPHNAGEMAGEPVPAAE